MMKLLLLITMTFLVTQPGMADTFEIVGATSAREIPKLKRTSDNAIISSPCLGFGDQRLPTTAYNKRTTRWELEKWNSDGYGCFYYQCRSKYGFQSSDSRICGLCPTSNPKDPTSGICGGCPPDQIYSHEQHGCIPATGYTSLIKNQKFNKNQHKYTWAHLRQCALFDNPDDYRICVLGCPTGQERADSNLNLPHDGGWVSNPNYVKCQNLSNR